MANKSAENVATSSSDASKTKPILAMKIKAD
jgi:hypothetical protein